MMLWLDLIDILYLVVGVIFGFILCGGIHQDFMDDLCDDCEYRKFIEEVLNDGE